MASHPASSSTQLYEDWQNGLPSGPALLPAMYEELRAMAKRYFRNQFAGHTLQTTALVHELWLRLAERSEIAHYSRERILAIGAQAIRRLLIDHARRKQALKRGGNGQRIALSELANPKDGPDECLLRLNDALLDLERMDAELHQVVILRFFGGLTIEETAHVLSRSPMTVKRMWRVARAWLHRQISAVED